MIPITKSKTHWNYFLALENDLENVARYIEFSESNFTTYSIELAHLLFAASSEVDVIAKLLCKKLSPQKKVENINDYRIILVEKLPDLVQFQVFIPRYGLTMTPWDNWTNTENEYPLWWRNYNQVKHQRDTHFDKATLKNALNSMAALLIVSYFYYSYDLTETGAKIYPKEITRQLEPKSTLMFLPSNFYFDNLIV